jgi:serine/threonine-protein kinase
VFASDRGGPYNLFSRAADGSGVEERLTHSANVQFPNAFSPDGKQPVVFEVTSTNADLMLLTSAGQGRTVPLVNTSASEGNGNLSSDGRWLAYQSNESGRFEIYVRPFPDVE